MIYNSHELLEESTYGELSKAFLETLKEYNLEKLSIAYKREVYTISIISSGIEIMDMSDNSNYTVLRFEDHNSDTHLKLARVSRMNFILSQKQEFYESFLNNLQHIRHTNSDLILNEI